jgi:hypothetical protein
MSRYADGGKDLNENERVQASVLPENEIKHTDKTPSLDGVVDFVRLMTGLIFVIGKVGIIAFGNELGEIVE